MSLDIRESAREGVIVLTMKGRLAVGESNALREKVNAVSAAGTQNIVLDLSQLDYIDSTGIGELVGYLGKFTTQNRKLILVNPSERIMKLLKLAKLDTVFKIYSTEEEAIAAESGSAAASA